MDDNPFAPPSAAADPAADRGLVFSPEGAAVVASLATWMRGLSIFLYLALALLAIGTCGMVTSGLPGEAGLVFGSVLLVLAVGIGAAASWLRSAASDFERGVLSDDEVPLGQGFRSLRAYLILAGLLSILTLLNELYQELG